MSLSSELRLEEGLDAPNLLSLPEDLIIDIASWLDQRSLCSMELASKRIYDVLLKPWGLSRCDST